MERLLHQKNLKTNREGLPEACVFDLDGTLIDSEPNYKKSDAAFFASYGVSYDEEFIRSVMGKGSADFLRIVERLYPESPVNKLPLEERLWLKDESYLGYARGRTRAFPAMKALAEELHRRGVRLAIASGSSPRVIDFALAEAGLSGLFDAVVSSTEVERGKPEPDIFLEAARRLGVEPGSCVVFEDSRNGALAADAAGMACVALPEEGADNPAFARAARVFPGGPGAASLAELLGALGEIAEGRGEAASRRGRAELRAEEGL